MLEWRGATGRLDPSVIGLMKPRRIRRILFTIFAVIGLALVGVSWFVGGALVVSSNHSVGFPPVGYRIESVTIDSESGSTLAAWFIPSQDATATVILLHPNRGDRRSMLGRAKLLNQLGYATLLIDLQGHGESPGENVTAGYRERLDVAATVEFVRTKYPNQKIGIIGRSLGGAAALLASPLNIDALVLESVYPTIAEAVHNRVSIRLGALSHLVAPVLLIQLKPRLGVSASDLRPIDHVMNVGCPVLVASGDCDSHTTLVETQRLYQAAREPKQLTIFNGASHIDLLAYDCVKYQEIIVFLDAHLRANEMESESSPLVTEKNEWTRAVIGVK